MPNSPQPLTWGACRDVTWIRCHVRRQTLNTIWGSEGHTVVFQRLALVVIEHRDVRFHCDLQRRTHYSLSSFSSPHSNRTWWKTLERGVDCIPHGPFWCVVSFNDKIVVKTQKRNKNRDKWTYARVGQVVVQAPVDHRKRKVTKETHRER